MEGPSLFLAAEQLTPFVGQEITAVAGSTKKIDKERLLNESVKAIFPYGKYLFFQCETFALRVHFLLYGSFEATVEEKKVTGDYPKKQRTPRLALSFKNGHIEMYSCSLNYIEEADAKMLCDYTIDIMSDKFDSKKALKAVKSYPDSEIADVLLDQEIFKGVGNIIKNEVLLLAKIAPTRQIKDLSLYKLKQIVSLTKDYVFKFYAWRKIFELKKHYIVYRQSVCKICGSKVSKRKTGARQRFSHICPCCQK